MSRAGFLPPSCDIILSVEMPSSRCTCADRHTHISATLSSPFAQGRRERFPAARIRPGSTLSAPVASVTWERDLGRARDRGVRGTSCCPGTQESEEELGGRSVVCVQGCSHLVSQPPAAVTNPYSSFAAPWTARPPPEAERRCRKLTQRTCPCSAPLQRTEQREAISVTIS